MRRKFKLKVSYTFNGWYDGSVRLPARRPHVLFPNNAERF